MYEIIKEFLEKYGFFIVGGAIGAAIHRIRKKMSNAKFIKFLIVAVCVALGTGIISREVFNISETVTYVICGLAGAFSEDLLDEIEEFIHSLSDILKKKFGLEIDEYSNKNKKQKDEDYEDI